ncbi:hypothetical protein pb186bvf_011139 [Paramecium bursaria]
MGLVSNFYIYVQTKVFAIQQMLLLQAQTQIMQAHMKQLQAQIESDRTSEQKLIIESLQRLLQSENIKIRDDFENRKLPILVKYIINIMVYVLENEEALEAKQYLAQIQKDPLTIIICQEQWDLLIKIIISKKVVLNIPKSELALNLMIKSLLFKDQIKNSIFKKLHQFSLNSSECIVTQVPVGSLSELLSLDHKNPEFLFKFLCDEQYLGISQCEQSLVNLFNLINKYFSSSNLIEEVISESGNKKIDPALEKFQDKYIYLLQLFQQSNKKETIDALIKGLYGGAIQIDSRDFISNSELLGVDLRQVLFLFPGLIKLENSIIDVVLQIKQKQEEQEPLKQYARLIEKIKNKCIARDDEICECKKCLCARRNRESAREAQKKKKDALEKIGPLIEEYEKLEKKVKILQDKNIQLKSILIDALQHPVVSTNIPQQIKEKIIASVNQNCNQSLGF